MSNSAIFEVTSCRRSGRRADTAERLTDAAMKVLENKGFSGLTMRLVANTAGVGSATAYTYFSSKEHLVAEIFWRRLAATPPPELPELNYAEQVVAVLRQVAKLAAGEPEFATAISHAVLGQDPAVDQLRRRIRSEIRHRLDSALGSGADPELLDSLEILYTGGLIQAGIVHHPAEEIVDRLERTARRLLR